jgi:hypothetical protein
VFGWVRHRHGLERCGERGASAVLIPEQLLRRLDGLDAVDAIAQTDTTNAQSRQ